MSQDFMLKKENFPRLWVTTLCICVVVAVVFLTPLTVLSHWELTLSKIKSVTIVLLAVEEYVFGSKIEWGFIPRNSSYRNCLDLTFRHRGTS